jgi:hypothetical protein
MKVVMPHVAKELSGLNRAEDMSILSKTGHHTIALTLNLRCLAVGGNKELTSLGVTN